MSNYNYPATYRSGAGQTSQASTGYYNPSRPAASSTSQYQAQTATSGPERHQYSHAPAYGTYNRTGYDTSASAQQYGSYAGPTQNPQYSQMQDTNHPSNYSQSRASAPIVPVNPSYYNQQQARQESSTPNNTASRQQYSAPGQANGMVADQQHRYNSSTQRHASPHWQAGQQSTTSNQYSNIRAESSQRPTYQPQSESSTTVDPSQVYDNTHERLRLAEQAKAETAKRMEEQKKAEEAKKAEAAERERVETETRLAAEEAAKVKEAESKKKQKDGSKTSKPKRKSKNAESLPSDDNQMQAAAMTLMRTANANGGDTTMLEAQMKEMFKKMREFNQKDPDMLSRLWQQERDDHLAKETGSTPAAASPSVQQPEASTSAAKPKSVKKKTPKKSQPTESGAQITPAVTTVPPGSVPKSTAIPQTMAPNESASNATPSTATSTRVRNTVWPSDKKAVIAEAASNLLGTMLSNNGHTLPAAEISQLLDANPRYELLCDQIEARGVKVDRSQFAKALLSAVPDVNRPKVAQRPSDGSINATPPAAQSTEKALAQAEKRIMKGANLVAKKPGRPAKDGSEATLENTPKQNTPTQNIPKQRKVTSAPIVPQPPIDPQIEGLDAVKMFVDGQWVEPAPPTPSKTTKDRKQSKAHQPKPSVEPGPPTKQDLARKRNFNDLIDLTQQLTDDDDDPYAWNPPAKRLQLEAQQATHLPSPPNTTMAGQTPPPALAVNGLAASFSSGQYGSATQNYLAAQSNPASVQPIQSSKPVTPVITLPIDHPARHHKLINVLDKRHALRRSSYDVRSIARDVLLACGRHPDMRHLNAHLEALKSLGPIDNTSDLSTFRWDLVDPGGPAPGSGVERLPQSVVPIEIDADDEDSDDDSVLGNAGVRQAVTVGGSANGYQTSTRDLHPFKQRGRPRKSEPVFRSRPENTPRAPGRPPGRPRHSEGAPGLTNLTGAPISGPGSYAALRAQQAATMGADVPKKKGRPVGWRKSMMANPSAYKGSSENRTAKTGRKKKSPSPQYQIYKCEWKDCSAELHNLVTLRAHIHKLHAKPGEDGKYTCQWRECNYYENFTDAHGSVKQDKKLYAFDTLQPWNHHVEERHINPVAWKLGDGPKGGVSDNYESDISESFMSDAQGRRITPRAIPPDENQPPQRQRTAAQKDAEQTRALAEQRKRDIGPSVDRGGATLVTDKQRRGLRDDEDVEMIVDESD